LDEKALKFADRYLDLWVSFGKITTQSQSPYFSSLYYRVMIRSQNFCDCLIRGWWV
jgi:hypothetical protein